MSFTGLLFSSREKAVAMEKYSSYGNMFETFVFQILPPLLLYGVFVSLGQTFNQKLLY